MNILQVHTRYRQAGGEDVAVATEAALLEGAGHDVRHLVFTNPEGGRAGMRLLVAPWNRSAARVVGRTIESYGPDVAHVHNTWFSLSHAVLPELHRLGVPVVQTLHNYRLICAAATLFRDGRPCVDCVGTNPWHAVRHRCYRDSAITSAAAASTIALHNARGTWHRDVDHFFALTEFGRQQFIKGGLPAEAISVKSNSVSDPGPRRAPPADSQTVAFIGRLSEEKGVASLLEAWKAVPPPLELLIVGTGPLEASLRAAAPPRVRFLGHQPKETLQELLLTARALVFPSIWFEGQGLVALEAAAAGLPVLLSDLGVMSNMFAPDASGLLMSPDDPAGIADRLLQLLDDTFVNHYGALTRRRFEEHFSHDVALQRLEEVYTRLRR